MAPALPLLIAKVSLLLAVPAALLFFRRALSADMRHFLAFAGLLAGAVVFLASPVIPALPVAVLPPPAPVGPALENAADAASGGGSGAGLLVLWLAGCAVLAAGQARSAKGAQRIAARGSETQSDRVRAVFFAAKRELGLSRPVRLLTVVGLAVPLAGGWVRPWVALPRSAGAWSRGRLRAVLLHELAHAARRDCLAQGIANLLVAVLWFHPLAWLLAGRMRTLREQACDDRVLARGARPSGYAGLLLRLFTQSAGVWPSTAAVAGLGGRADLSGRIRTVLSLGVSRAVLASRGRVAIAGALVVAALATAALSPVAAQAPLPQAAVLPSAPPALPEVSAFAPTEAGESGEAVTEFAPIPRPARPAVEPGPRVREVLSHLVGRVDKALVSTGSRGHPAVRLAGELLGGEWSPAPGGGLELIISTGRMSSGGASRAKVRAFAYVGTRRR